MLADYLLPVTGGFLRPCLVPNRLLTSVDGGHHCASCQRTVHDFTRATAAEVAQAQRAAPDGRLCGRFQVAGIQRPGFSRRLRCFVVALVLIVGRGLTAQEALAQVQQATPSGVAKNSVQRPYGMVEQMPQYKGAGLVEVVKVVQHNFKYSPVGRQKPTGKVYVSFSVDREGKVRDVSIAKGSSALIDSAAIQAIKMLADFTPGTQNGLPVAVSLTIPISYTNPK